MTQRQKAVFTFLSRGLTAGKIAKIKGVSENTIRSHIRAVLEGRGYKTIAQAVYSLAKTNVI